ncbi:hypothetical protein B0T10DRAFT_568967 [Thelonectria olida]|uniref:Uncharacterized protein n=1 Tax=Thelonectria olida TaxID=1576542 RepID=A0A9P8VMV2_9HYPO|nr:hypothetical protein B0T10DRAFT_568967 [Thelonectria olida]
MAVSTDKSAPYCQSVSIEIGITNYFCDDIYISTTQIAYSTYHDETDGRTFETLSCPHSPPPPTPVGAIVGGVIGGVAAISLAGLGLVLFLRKRKKRKTQGSRNTNPPPYPGISDRSNQSDSFSLNITDPVMRQGPTSRDPSDAGYIVPVDQQTSQQQGGIRLQHVKIHEAPSNVIDQHRGKMQELPSCA